MREIKFRAWIKNHKQMIFLTAVAFGDLIDNHKKGFEIMQFTGLKDKNRKEIYEGDIVELERAKYQVYWHQHIAKWELERLNIKGFSNIGLINWNNCEVIGNKFENPELLK